MQTGEMIDLYEAAVLEWFHAAYSPIVSAVYAEDSSALFGKDRTIRYPSMVYHREESDWVLPKLLPAYDRDESGKLVEARMFHAEQVYVADIFVEQQGELVKLANVLRQYWADHSYVYIRFPTDADLLKVGFRLYSMKLVSNRNNLDKKGPERALRITWRSDLVLFDTVNAPFWDSYRLWITPNGVQRERWLVTEGDIPSPSPEELLRDIRKGV